MRYTVTRVSMATVAAHVGVSGQTVSRVVHGSPRVDPDTRRRVEQAMADLGYRPHRAARALRTGRSQTIGVVVASLGTVGNFRMLQGVTESAKQRGLAVMVMTATDAESLGTALGRLHEENADGAIVLNEASAFLPHAIHPAGLALVVVDAAPSPLYATVASSHAEGARQAVAYLLAAGHPVVHHLAGPADSFAAHQRERGWRQALHDAGITPPPPVRGDWSAQSGYDAAAQLMNATAVLSANDHMALGLIRACAEHGRSVPGDVSIIGFDDVPEAANYLPPLTTVRQDFAALAETAVRLLDAPEAREAPHHSPTNEQIATSLVIRASVADHGTKV